MIAGVDSSAATRFRRAALGGAALAGGLSAVALGGWTVGQLRLARIVPGLSTMAVATAVCGLLCCACVFLEDAEAHHRQAWLGRAKRVGAGIVVAFALYTMTSYAFDEVGLPEGCPGRDMSLAPP